MTRQRLNAQEASEALGISVDAVRTRARRGTLDSGHENGRLYVWVDNHETDVHPQGHVEALIREKDSRIAELLEQVHHLREVLEKGDDTRRRADTIIAQLTQANAALAQRVPELGGPQRPSGAAEGVAKEQDGAQQSRSAAEGARGGTEEPPRRSWWREFFGF